MPKRRSCLTCTQQIVFAAVTYRAAHFCCEPCRTVYVRKLKVRLRERPRSRSGLSTSAGNRAPSRTIMAPRCAAGFAKTLSQ
jgi:hypothetical protein